MPAAFTNVEAAEAGGESLSRQGVPPKAKMILKESNFQCSASLFTI
jgi:hypothetical protein